MKYEINDNFICISKPPVLSVTSVLPDMNQIYNFQGVSADILKEWFDSKSVDLDRATWESKFNQKIEAKDWDTLTEFLVKNQIIIPTK